MKGYYVGMKGNRTNHPPRKNVPITAHKGGREKRTFLLTEADLKKLKEHADQQKISLNDALSQAIAKL